MIGISIIHQQKKSSIKNSIYQRFKMKSTIYHLKHIMNNLHINKKEQMTMSGRFLID